VDFLRKVNEAMRVFRWRCIGENAAPLPLFTGDLTALLHLTLALDLPGEAS
jgi:hypothetical protein